MAGKLPVFSLPGPKGTSGSAGDPGYQGAWGTTAGVALGTSIGGIPGGIIGAAIGAAADWLAGKHTYRAPRPGRAPKPRPGFAPPTTYKAVTTNLRDPGSGAGGFGMPQNVRLAAASNIKSKLFGQGA
jgi:hypothetical protein